MRTLTRRDFIKRGTVVIQFPDAGAIAGWYRSPAYQALIPLRSQAAEMVLISYES